MYQPASSFFARAAMTNPSTPNRRLRTGLAIGLSFIVGIFVFLTTFTLIKHFTPASTQGLLPPSERSPAALKLPTLAGTTWSLTDHAGQVVIINYFATWCPPCREEMPELQKIAAEFSSKNVHTVAISFDQDAQLGKPFLPVVTDYVAAEKIEFPVLIPPRDSGLFAVETPLPQTFLIDKHGRTAQSILGPIDPKDIRASLDKLINEE